MERLGFSATFRPKMNDDSSGCLSYRSWVNPSPSFMRALGRPRSKPNGFRAHNPKP